MAASCGGPIAAISRAYSGTLTYLEIVGDQVTAHDGAAAGGEAMGDAMKGVWLHLGCCSRAGFRRGAAPSHCSPATRRSASPSRARSRHRSPRRGSSNRRPRDATLTLAGPRPYPVRFRARGITRRTAGTCSFPPLRVDFTQPPAASSLFAGQKRLKLVTHCRAGEGPSSICCSNIPPIRIFNLITPISFRARLAPVDYAEPNGKVSTTRWGFFIEDLDDAAKRNGTDRGAGRRSHPGGPAGAQAGGPRCACSNI